MKSVIIAVTAVGHLPTEELNEELAVFDGQPHNVEFCKTKVSVETYGSGSELVYIPRLPM